MKTRLIILLLWSVALVASAQSIDPSSQRYSRLDLSLVTSQPVARGNGVPLVSTHSLSGLGVDYVYGINVTDGRLPLFLEFGPELSFVRRTDDVDYWEDSAPVVHYEINTRLLTLGTPLNMTYLRRITDAVVLAPSAGLSARLNLLAKTSSEGRTVNLFDQGAHRFQLGCNVGCGVYLGRYYLGLRYSADFTPFISEGKDKEGYQNLSLSVGYSF